MRHRVDWLVLADALVDLGRYASVDTLERIRVVSDPTALAIEQLVELAPAELVRLLGDVFVAVAERHGRSDLVQAVRQAAFDARSTREAHEILCSFQALRSADERVTRDIGRALAVLARRGVYVPERLVDLAAFLKSVALRGRVQLGTQGEIRAVDHQLDVADTVDAALSYAHREPDWVRWAVDRVTGSAVRNEEVIEREQDRRGIAEGPLGARVDEYAVG